MPPLLTAAAVLACLALAAWFRPWQALREPALRGPWLAALVLLPPLWSVPALLPRNLPALTLSGACLLVLVLGWPLAVWTLPAIGLAAALLRGQPGLAALDTLWWQGLLPATLALGFGLLARRWLPPNPFSYVLGRAFAATIAALTVSHSLALWWLPLSAGTDAESAWIGGWLMAWGEAITTGMLAAAAVAWRPEGLLTWSDRRYLR
ncbi:hypothetical protein [Piscinibacter sakaiensis]|uniref:Putative integral membrane protein n=1 Tax=Piscinibacter sakaiensis TaxID=1547922 RepID=A0A0K8NX70_PISS1|nr:hypothetical protein [Piscinibacter sakaiensis]GAP34973.1 putative integral membrane protein [Piscinibacter sakaiensis]